MVILRSLKSFCLTMFIIFGVSESAIAADSLHKNKQLVIDFYQQVLLEGELDRIDQFIGDTYIQHNPRGKDGKEALVALFSQMEKPVKGKPRGKIIRSMAEGDLVMVHVHWYNWPTERGTATMDIFRIEKGLIAEHWDVVQAVPETAKNTNTMF